MKGEIISDREYQKNYRDAFSLADELKAEREKEANNVRQASSDEEQLLLFATGGAT